MKHQVHILFIYCLLLPICGYSILFTSCSSNDEGYLNAIVPPTETQRILIAYLAGDNNLTSEIEQKITALTNGFLATTNNISQRLFIYYDRKDASPLLIEINRQTENEHHRTVKTYTAQNSASAEVMRQILNDILKDYPAKSYGLILFSHGTAWLPAGGLNNPYIPATTDSRTAPVTRTVATDNDNEMELTDFASALPLPNEKKWEFLLFEGCYMGSVEVAYELKEKTKAIIASPTEIVSPGMRDVYPTALSCLYQETPDLTSFARAYFDTWNSKTGIHRSATISVIRTERLEELASLARAAFIRWQPDTETISSLQCFNRNRWQLFFDLEEAMNTANPALEAHTRQLLAQTVMYAAATPAFLLPDMAYGFAIEKYCGLSCYIPQNELYGANREYMKTAWYEAVYK